VDKVVGEALLSGELPMAERLLQVSGRVSFEIVQKAARAGIPLIAAVSAPSSLAVEAAERLGMTVVGFVRDGRFNVYTHPERIAG
jgi:FdhD protein